MSRRRPEERAGGRAAKQHLYLLFDDWPEGYSVRMLDLSSDDPYGWQMDAGVSRQGDTVCAGDHRLPPAIFRFEALRGLPMHFAAAFDSKIIATQHVDPAASQAPVLEHVVPVLDVRMRSCIFGPRLEPEPSDPIYIPAAGKLFALATGTFHLLDPPPPSRPPPPTPPQYRYGREEARVWSWRELPAPPFKRRRVTSYAIHPDGHTIFVSIKKRASAATFSLDTAGCALQLQDGGCGWKRHGKWALPFTGRAHFDAELDAWVGLSTDPDSIGHLCCCDAVALPTGSDKQQCPPRKLSKEKLFSEDPTYRHVGATLVYMGGRSEFCLVECVSIEDDDRADDNMSDLDLEEDGNDCSDGVERGNDCNMEEDSCADNASDSDTEEEDDGCGDDRDDFEQNGQDVSRARRYLFRLTTFNLKYDKNGDLTTGISRRVRYYRVPKASTEALLSNPVAFWM